MPNSAAVQTAIDNQEMGKPYISYIEDEHRIDWNTAEEKKDYASMYLTFEIISGGTMYFKNTQATSTGSTSKRIIYISKDSGVTWDAIDNLKTGGTNQFRVNAGDKVILKGTNNNYGSTSKYYTTSFSGSTAVFNVYGNIMSLLYGDNFSGQTTLVSLYTFTYLFSCCPGLISSENLVLPATTLQPSAYYHMFEDCTGLVAVPKKLPATTLVKLCYAGMFTRCTSLSAVPHDMLATITGSGLDTNRPYSTMFLGCTSLVAGPDLLSETIYSSSSNPATYYCMFSGCTSLNYVKCLATGNTIEQVGWLAGVSPTGTFVKHPDASWTSGVNGIPEGWTVETAYN